MNSSLLMDLKVTFTSRLTSQKMKMMLICWSRRRNSNWYNAGWHIKSYWVTVTCPNLILSSLVHLSFWSPNVCVTVTFPNSLCSPSSRCFACWCSTTATKRQRTTKGPAQRPWRKGQWFWTASSPGSRQTAVQFAEFHLETSIAFYASSEASNNFGKNVLYFHNT